jgi:hypothetical protein
VGGQRHAPAALPPWKARHPLYRRLGGPQDRSGRVRKISPPQGFDPRTAQPVASRYADWAIAAHTTNYTARFFYHCPEHRSCHGMFRRMHGFCTTVPCSVRRWDEDPVAGLLFGPEGRHLSPPFMQELVYVKAASWERRVCQLSTFRYPHGQKQGVHYVTRRTKTSGARSLLHLPAGQVCVSARSVVSELARGTLWRIREGRR